MENLDLLMVLAGENPKTRPRTSHAIKVHKEMGAVHGSKIPIYFSGSHAGVNGITLPAGKISLCEQMRQYALRQGVIDTNIILEQPRQGVGSLDTFANLVYAWDLIPSQFSEVGLFSERDHMERVLWCARKVFDRRAEFFTFSSEPDVIRGSVGRMQEKLSLQTLRFDLRNISEGDRYKIQEYMEMVHPFHALTYGNKPRASFYGVMAFVGKVLNARSREKQEFFED